MKKLSKIVSVVLSLALCLGMASPAFAASFQDLHIAINGSGGTEFTAEDGSTRYGYAENKDDDGNHVSWGIEAWDGSRNVLDEQGNETGETTSTRYVQLNESVEADRRRKTVSISGDGKDFTIDLNGYDIDGNKRAGSVVTVANGGKLTLEDSSGDGSGKITGGKGATGDPNYSPTFGDGYQCGGGIYVTGEGSSFVMNSGNITGNGTSDYNWQSRGGGVIVTDGASFTMNGGAITGNNAYAGGGVMVDEDSTFILNSGEIANNHTDMGGGVASAGTFIMHGGAINSNSAGDAEASEYFQTGGGVCLAGGSFTMDGGSISNNTAGAGGGIENLERYEVKITGGCICNNTETGVIGNSAADWISEITGSEFDPNDSATTLKLLADNGYVVNELHHEFGEWVDNGDGTRTRTCTGCGSQENDGTPITPDDSTGDTGDNGSTGSAGDTGDTGDISDIGDIGDIGDTGSGFIPADVSPVTIADQEVPLAGLVSRQILVSALYVQAGSPDGEDAGGEYTKALAWAAANGIIDEDADPEETVTVAILRDVMTRYAKILNVIFDVEIPGENDEIVMNCNEILEKFFAAQEDKAA